MFTIKSSFSFSISVKTSQFSFTRLSGADPTLGVEMASTGEVGCLGEDFYEALLKSLTSVGIKLNLKKVLLSNGPEKQKHNLLASCQKLQSIGVKIYATWGTQKFLEKYGVKATSVSWPDRKKKDNVLTLIEKEKLDLIVNIPQKFSRKRNYKRLQNSQKSSRFCCSVNYQWRAFYSLCGSVRILSKSKMEIQILG